MRLADSHVSVKTFYDIDTPITLGSVCASMDRTGYLEARQIPIFDVYFSFTGGPMLRELETHFGARRAVPLYCSFDPQTVSPLWSKSSFCVRSQLHGHVRSRSSTQNRRASLRAGTTSAADEFHRRRPAVSARSALAFERRRIQHLNPRWHAKFYCSSRFTLNVTRRDMVMAGYSPSVRLFEAAACGATHHLR